MNGVYICIILIALANIVNIINAEREKVQVYKMIVETNRVLLEMGIELKKIKEELADE